MVRAKRCCVHAYFRINAFQSVRYFSIGFRGTWDPTSYPGKNNWRATKQKTNLLPFLPEFAQGLPEFCPKFCPNSVHRHFLGGGGGGGHSAPCPRLLRLWIYHLISLSLTLNKLQSCNSFFRRNKVNSNLNAQKASVLYQNFQKILTMDSPTPCTTLP